MAKDKVFAEKKNKVKPFEFNKEVADVFDDMLNRSVPLYMESIERQSKLTAQYYQAGSRIYDLGCSHGNLGILILNQLKERPFSMVAVDSSKPMIEKYKKRLVYQGKTRPVDLVCGFLENIHIKNASVVLINLTLQFLDMKKRDALIKKIYQGMNPNGILLLTEKTVHESKQLDDLQTSFYKIFKLENGYSELEISQKRDALEKVLIPDTIETHKNRILNAGFALFDVWLKWFNFASMIAIKK
ncbi:carboxy-S-adenosyl-L-methionine synthase CmoA [Desulfobacula phenolica]|uniref:Carboxy-S-adenosyl-L-methionine synthase n=1 Tax=Desulfobacula phenolica TaxID=90732 RepID=A0A1H2GNH5_9BACT|nr:carboxy-S-adenosyl-L-methionine synthase CmoA [Desulfobacula phenolica]SDU21104.1 tRNA (cmo5U34)-methyltransferase [Desulfobacula phenolica]